MNRGWTIVVLLAACRFRADGASDAPSGPRDGSAGSADAREHDGSDSGSDAAPPTDCLTAWKLGGSALELSTPSELVELEDAQSTFERDPFVSFDETTIYFASDRLGDGDIFAATRAGSNGTFGTPAAIGAIDDAGDQSKITFAGSDTTRAIYASSGDTGGGATDLFATTRDGSGTFDTASRTPFPTIDDSADQNDPWLSPDGVRLYYADNNGGSQKLLVATRSGSAFGGGAQAAFVNINGDNADSHADPTLSADETIIIVSEIRGTAVTLAYATRATGSDVFDAPTAVPIPNNASHFDGNPHLSQDGCRLYWASNRADGADHVFVSTVTPK